MIPRIPAGRGMLAHLVGRTRPELAERIAETNRVETALVGLGRQGKRHAGLMRDYGTSVTAAVSPTEELPRIHEVVPVYHTVAEMLRAHPQVAAASIWKHHSSAADAALEVIEAGVPIVVLITEGMPVRDVRRVLVAARARGTLLFGPNTPGIIFPPERVKIGMLPDVFHPAEPEPGRFSARGVTICSRSGAILYHMSDALSSAGIAQNAVIGVGGDAAVGTPFPAVVPLVSGFTETDLVVVAGEIGGSAEEMLAADIQAHPERYPKPIVALLSGRCAPEGKTMGHAGAIVAPGADFGTYASKRAALEAAGVTVVNSQTDLIVEVRRALGGRTYFQPSRYYARMREMWEATPPKPSWGTRITRVEPNNLVIRGIPLAELVGRRSLVEVAALLSGGELPSEQERDRLDRLAVEAAQKPLPEIGELPGDISRQLATILMADPALAAFEGDEVEHTVFALGRTAAAFARILGQESPGADSNEGLRFSELACRALAGPQSPERTRLLEAAMVASVDHGVTPPSAQATILASTVRPAFEVALAAGIMAITDVHGGAGARAAEFFQACHRRPGPLQESIEAEIRHRIENRRRIEGLGHRIHTRDPRRDVLWSLAEASGVAGPCVEASRLAGAAFERVKGISLPVNVDGVIGAIVADMGLDSRVAKALFVFGRTAGLAAHHFEETATQPKMRRVDFSRAEYRGE